MAQDFLTQDAQSGDTAQVYHQRPRFLFEPYDADLSQEEPARGTTHAPLGLFF